MGGGGTKQTVQMQYTSPNSVWIKTWSIDSIYRLVVVLQ